MSKDWTGNKNSVFKTLGASNHTEKERQSEDYYATSPDAIDRLRTACTIPHYVWECACGAGHLSKRLLSFGHSVYSTDLVNRGYGVSDNDFLMQFELPWQGAETSDFCILTNPPYKLATEFIEHSLMIAPYDNTPVFFLLKTTALEGKARRERLFSKGYLHAVYQFSERLLCAKNGDFEVMKAGGGSAVAYAWFEFRRQPAKDTIIKWI